jgi:hypothetical protein
MQQKGFSAEGSPTGSKEVSFAGRTSSPSANSQDKPLLLVWHGSGLGKTTLLSQAGLTNQALISSNPDHSGFVVAVDDLKNGFSARKLGGLRFFSP